MNDSDSGRYAGRPIDPWISALTKQGMQMFGVDEHAMTVTVSESVFTAYQEDWKQKRWYQPDQDNKPRIWECGEVGAWTIDPSTGGATYQEKNMWGFLYESPQTKTITGSIYTT